jgi:TonB family protein
MKRVFGLIIILGLASAGATGAIAQSRRVRRAEEPPKETRAETPEPNDKGEGEAKDEAKDRSADGARASGDRPLTGNEVVERAVIRSKPDPAYPREARRYRVQGEVKLRIVLGADGKVRDRVDVLESLPHGVTEEAIKAARRIEFEPARKDGRPVSQYITVIYHFRLH